MGKVLQFRRKEEKAKWDFPVMRRNEADMVECCMCRKTVDGETTRPFTIYSSAGMPRVGSLCPKCDYLKKGR